MVVKSGNQPMTGDYYQNRYGTKEIDVSIPLVGCFCCQIPGLCPNADIANPEFAVS
jgi:hypothetical protein